MINEKLRFLISHPQNFFHFLLCYLCRSLIYIALVMPMEKWCLLMLPVLRVSQVHWLVIFQKNHHTSLYSLETFYVFTHISFLCSHWNYLWQGSCAQPFKHPCCLFYPSWDQYGWPHWGKAKFSTSSDIFFVMNVISSDNMSLNWDISEWICFRNFCTSVLYLLLPCSFSYLML